ncbi:hypothetical protein HIM_10437 [Hirsutella minnesotensis 3608]|uniref:Protein kinase domain-containing protein n=1 Tax=Hirsutella minnesotensis 3608 TaxID=1043627 RepID=A0A0F7ZX64_9HYPO|nr:hypothetical protein HIM_10437 [Hirsutella minnesotensis 3608]
MGVAYLHSRGICHGDLHLRNILFRDPHLGELSPDLLYKSYRLDQAPISRVDGAPVEPHAPPYAVYPMHMRMAADKLIDPIITISDYGTSFILATERSPELHTPPLFLPPGRLLSGTHHTGGGYMDTWHDIIADIVSTLGQPPARWWDKWENRKEFFELDGSWVHNLQRIYTPVFRPLHQRMWDMGRGMTPETCDWDVEGGGEMQALEEMLKGMLAFEPSERPTAEQLMKSEYMVKWAMPAWEPKTHSGDIIEGQGNHIRERSMPDSYPNMHGGSVAHLPVMNTMITIEISVFVLAIS